MTNKDKETLYGLLHEWFKDTNLKEKSVNIFNQNNIAKLIKQKIKEIGHWKEKPRGKSNNIDNLNKGKRNKEELEQEIIKLKESVVKCPCGKPLVVRQNKAFCSDFWCDKLQI